MQQSGLWEFKDLIERHPGATPAIGGAALIACVFGAHYSVLAVGVSDGSGLITARLMLSGCIIAALAASLMTWRAASALLMRL